MKKSFIIFICIFLSFNTFAKKQKNNSKEVIDLLKNISSSYGKIESFQADFVQRKTSSLLKNSAITKGIVVFKKPDNISIKFTSPYNIGLFLNGNKITKIDENNNFYSTISLKKQKSNLLNFLNISKTFHFLDKYFYIKKINTKSNLIYIICIPKKRKVKKKLKIVELWLYPKTYLFKKLKIEEPDNTITEIEIGNTKINKHINENIFKFSIKNMDKKEWRQ